MRTSSVYEKAMCAVEEGVNYPRFKLGDAVRVDGRREGVVVGKTIEPQPVYDVRLAGSSREIVLYVSGSRLTLVE